MNSMMKKCKLLLTNRKLLYKDYKIYEIQAKKTSQLENQIVLDCEILNDCLFDYNESDVSYYM